MSSLALIGLGSNLGDRRAALDGAIASLNQTPGVTVIRISSFHETEPEGGPAGQGMFLNAAAVLETTRDPFALLAILRQVEARAGRVRTVPNGPRTLDLDLLYFNDEVIDTPDLTVPHPRSASRAFVLGPLAEVAPEAVDPVTGLTVAAMWSELQQTLRSGAPRAPVHVDAV